MEAHGHRDRVPLSFSFFSTSSRVILFSASFSSLFEVLIFGFLGVGDGGEEGNSWFTESFDHGWAFWEEGCGGDPWGCFVTTGSCSGCFGMFTIVFFRFCFVFGVLGLRFRSYLNLVMCSGFVFGVWRLEILICWCFLCFWGFELGFVGWVVIESYVLVMFDCGVWELVLFVHCFDVFDCRMGEKLERIHWVLRLHHQRSKQLRTRLGRHRAWLLVSFSSFSLNLWICLFAYGCWLVKFTTFVES